MARYLITGGAGFIGSNLAHALVAPVEYLWRIPQVVIWRRPRPTPAGGPR